MSETIPRWGAEDYNPIEFEPKKMKANCLERLGEAVGRELAEADPLSAVSLVLLDRIIQALSDVNEACKQQFLVFALGKALDAYATTFALDRLPASGAVADFEFKLSTILPNAYLITAGTQITNGLIIFETTEAVSIPAGEKIAYVRGVCLEAGTTGNGYLEGQINVLVNPLPYIESVKNITVTAGGADEESDAAYAERLHKVTNSITTAGPIESYKFWAKSASAAIADVQVFTPTPCHVQVFLILQNGELPTDTVRDLVYDVLNKEEIRPLGDLVEVLAPERVPYNVNLEYFINNEDKTRAVTIQSKVAEAVQSYLLWQKEKIGRDVVPDELISAIVKAGAKRVVVHEPVFTVLQDYQIAQDEDVKIIFSGFEEG